MKCKLQEASVEVCCSIFFLLTPSHLNWFTNDAILNMRFVMKTLNTKQS